MNQRIGKQKCTPPGYKPSRLGHAMREIRYLDKLIDELAKGKAMDKILRKQTQA